MLDDLARETDTALRGRAMTALGRLVLACLRHARDAEGLMRALGECAELVREVIAAPHGVAALQAVVRYVLMVHPAPAEIALRQLQEVLEDETVKEAVMTAGEELIRMGELRGEARGEARGRRAVLRKLLVHRFGELPEGALARLDAADVGTLDTWTERALSAATLDEVLGSTQT